jgi:hypothetical protein
MSQTIKVFKTREVTVSTITGSKKVRCALCKLYLRDRPAERLKIGDIAKQNTGTLVLVSSLAHLELLKDSGAIRMEIFVMAKEEGFKPKLICNGDNVSWKQKQAIVEGKIRHDDDVYVQCEPVVEKNHIDNMAEPIISHYEVEFTPNDHVCMHRVTEEKFTRSQVVDMLRSFKKDTEFLSQSEFMSTRKHLTIEQLENEWFALKLAEKEVIHES